MQLPVVLGRDGLGGSGAVSSQATIGKLGRPGESIGYAAGGGVTAGIGMLAG
jgi:hypothetical protein